MLYEVITPNRKAHPDDYWIPLVLLHTGPSPSEICRLRTKDVVTLGRD